MNMPESTTSRFYTYTDSQLVNSQRGQTAGGKWWEGNNPKETTSGRFQTYTDGDREPRT